MTELAETELISPLLDGFAMGNPMSSHDGVRCCPAIKENSDEKYIVKNHFRTSRADADGCDASGWRL